MSGFCFSPNLIGPTWNSLNSSVTSTTPRSGGDFYSEILRKPAKNKMTEKSNARGSNPADLSDVILNEVALEGLEGLTLQSLWIRLREYYSCHGQTVDVSDGKFQKAAWTCVLAQSEIRLFILPETEARPVIPENEYKKLEHYTVSSVSPKRKLADVEKEEKPDDNETLQAEEQNDDVALGRYVKGWEREREVAATPLNSYGIYFKKTQTLRGSCRFLDEREDVTESIRVEKMNLKAVQNRYGDRLVLVAEEPVRLKVLGVDKLTPAQAKKIAAPSMYAILEIFGRHRHYGEFIIFDGWTVFGRGSRNLKQIHNCVTVLQELDLVTKDKARFMKDLTSREIFQVYTFAFLKSMSRVVETPADSYLTRTENMIRSAAIPYPSELLPRLEGAKFRNDSDFRRRLRRYFPGLDTVRLPKADLISLYPSVEKLKGDTISCVVFGQTPSSASPDTKKVTMKHENKFVIPEELAFDKENVRKSIFLAILQLLKANRERGMSEVDLSGALAAYGATKRQTHRVLEKVYETGYAKIVGHFRTRNHPKRFMLVSSEAERLSLSGKQSLSDHPRENPNEKSGHPINMPSVHRDAQSLQRTQILSMAACWKVFPEFVSLNEFGRFFCADYETIKLTDIHDVIADAISTGALENRLVPTNKNLFRGINPRNRNQVEMTSFFVSRESATDEDVSNYLETFTFRNTLATFVGSAHVPSSAENVPCSDVFVQSRLWRLRIMHRYLFYLAHESADAPAVNGTWKEHIRHARFADGYKGWVTMEQIIQRMPLAVFARMFPVGLPVGDDSDTADGTIKKSIETSPISLLALCQQSAEVLRYIFSDRRPVYVLRDFLYGLRCMGLVSLGPSDGTISYGLYPERTEVFYIHPTFAAKDTAQVPPKDIAYGLMSQEISAAVPDKIFHFKTDDDITNFWWHIGNLALPCRTPYRARRVVTYKRSETVKSRLPEAYNVYYPSTLIQPARPPGDQLAIAGFDSSLTLHVGNIWKRLEVIAMRMPNTKGYLPGLDEFKLDWRNARALLPSISEKSPKRSRASKSVGSVSRSRRLDPDFADPDVIQVKTEGRGLKRGPKVDKVKTTILRGSNAEIARMFSHGNSASPLFCQTRPWQQGEELMMCAYIGARDLIQAVRKRPVNIGLLKESLEEFFPEKRFPRSDLELEVRLAARQRDQAFMAASATASQIMQAQPEYRIVRLRFRHVVLDDQQSLKALHSSWKKLVHMCVDAVLRTRQHLRRKLLAPPPAAVMISRTEAAQQFALESLILSLCLTNDIWSEDMETVKDDYNDRVIVGMGTYLKFRGVMSSRKMYERIRDPSIMAVGRVAMGLSFRFNQIMQTVDKRAVGNLLRASNIAAIGCQEVDPQILPHWWGPIGAGQARVGCTLQEIDKNIRILEKSSTIIEPLTRTARDEKKFKPLRLNGFRLRNALPCVVAAVRTLQESINERFSVLRAQLEEPVQLLKDAYSAQDASISLGFEMTVEDYSDAMTVYDCIRGAKEVGLTKGDLWNLMEENRAVSLEKCQKALNALVKKQLVIPAGIEPVFYVAVIHAGPWVYRHGQSLTGFQPRPWLRVTGKISPVVFFKYLQWMSWFICAKRTVLLEELLNEFQPFMLGRNTLELISILCDLRLIQKFRFIDEESPLVELTDENEWMDDDDPKQIYVSCKGDTWDCAMGLSLLEEELGLCPRTDLTAVVVEDDSGEMDEDEQTEEAGDVLSQIGGDDDDEEEEEDDSDGESVVQDDKSQTDVVEEVLAEDSDVDADDTADKLEDTVDETEGQFWDEEESSDDETAE